MKRTLLVVIGVLIVFVVIQAWRPELTNPAADPALSFGASSAVPPSVGAVIERACGDCHSHGTVWPWYSHVAPASWLVASDVADGRRHLNLSTWGQLSPERARETLGEMCREVRAGAMPPWFYRLMHPEARLTEADVAALCGTAGEGTGRSR